MQDEIRGMDGLPEWQPYLRGERPMPEWPDAMLASAAVVMYYLGDQTRAQELSYAASQAYEQAALRAYKHGSGSIHHLFQAALYRNLADRRDEALPLWEQVVELQRHMDQQYGNHHNNRYGIELTWVAYALLHLGRYAEVQAPAHQGRLEILLRLPDSTYYSREMYLGDVLITLAAFFLDSYGDDLEREMRAIERARGPFAQYVEHNRHTYRRGYGVVFDLQNTFRSVYYNRELPGEDPTRD